MNATIIDEKYTTAVAIDIGVKNLGIYCETFPHSLRSKKLPLKRYNSNHEPLDDFKSSINSTLNEGSCIFFDKVDLSGGKKVKGMIPYDVIMNCLEYMNSKKFIFDACDYVLIEAQLKRNPVAQQLELFIFSWFAINYKNTKLILRYPSKNKTTVLGAPKKIMIKDKLKKMDKPNRKKWSVKLAKELLLKRGSEHLVNELDCKSKKLDDICDCILMIVAFKVQLCDRVYV